MSATVEEFVERWCENGEEDQVGENLTLNRGPAKPEDLTPMQQDVPPNTVVIPAWSFGDDVQRIWVNPDYPFFAAFSALSHSIHVWRYPNRLSFLRHVDEVAEFFGNRPFNGLKDVLDGLNDPNYPEDKLDRPLVESLEILDKESVEAAFGPLQFITPRELQVEQMMERLAE